jgi:hypothetical protein
MAVVPHTELMKRFESLGYTVTRTPNQWGETCELSKNGINITLDYYTHRNKEYYNFEYEGRKLKHVDTIINKVEGEYHSRYRKQQQRDLTKTLEKRLSTVMKYFKMDSYISTYSGDLKTTFDMRDYLKEKVTSLVSELEEFINTVKLTVAVVTYNEGKEIELRFKLETNIFDEDMIKELKIFTEKFKEAWEMAAI